MTDITVTARDYLIGFRLDYEQTQEAIMKGQRNTPEYWISLVEQHFYLGNEFALIPVSSLPEQTAIELADRLDVLLERWDDEYIFQQKKYESLMPGPDEDLH